MPDLAHVDFVLELARRGAALREDAGAVAERVVVDELDGLIERVDADDDHHRPEDFRGVDLHVGRDAGEDRRPDEIALLDSPAP